MIKENLYEILGDINEDYVRQAHMPEKKKNSYIWRRWGALAACLGLIVASALVIQKLQTNPVHTNPPSIDHPTIDTQQPNSKNSIFVNNAKEIASADMDVQLTHYPNLSVAENNPGLKQFETVIGASLNDFISKIPDIFAFHAFYSVDVPADATREEYIPHDYEFAYRTEHGGEISIAICAAEEPLRDIFIVCDHPKQSEINGYPVVIFGYQDDFFVRFSWNQINYDIETKNITIEELEQLLAGIIHGDSRADTVLDGVLDGGADIGLDTEPENSTTDTILEGILDGGADIGLDTAP